MSGVEDRVRTAGASAMVPRASPRVTTTPVRPTILFVSPVPDFKGGAERVLVDLLSNPSISPALAVPAEGALAAYARDQGIPVRMFGLGAVAAVRRKPRARDLLQAANGARICARQLADAARDTGAVLIHTNGLKVHVVGGLTRLLHGMKVLAHVHDIPYTRLEKLIWRGVGAGATRTIIVSRPCYPAGGPNGPLPRRVAVVSNGVRPLPSQAPRRTTPAEPTIGYVGRIHPFKGLHVLLGWFEQASATIPELRLLIRGRADEEGAAYWQSLQARIAPLVAQGRCRVLDWAGPGEDPYEGIDILAVPSEAPDPAPLVIPEAMQRGIPCIGARTGGIPGLIGGPDTGALASDATEFTTALTRLLDPATYSATSAAAAARVRDTFTLERFWQAVNAQYALAGVEIAGPIDTSAPAR